MAAQAAGSPALIRRGSAVMGPGSSPQLGGGVQLTPNQLLRGSPGAQFGLAQPQPMSAYGLQPASPLLQPGSVGALQLRVGPAPPSSLQAPRSPTLLKGSPGMQAPATTSALTIIRAGSLPPRSPQAPPASEPQYANALALVPAARQSARSPPPKLLRGSPGAQNASGPGGSSGEAEADPVFQKAGAPRLAQRSAAPPRPTVPESAGSFGKAQVKMRSSC